MQQRGDKKTFSLPLLLQALLFKLCHCGGGVVRFCLLARLQGGWLEKREGEKKTDDSTYSIDKRRWLVGLNCGAVGG